ncbi:MAG: response regulator [Candidatus Omnitrophica bacterium]|nr:response regulator [Candidatus Omnitrophota bacterium]
MNLSVLFVDDEVFNSTGMMQYFRTFGFTNVAEVRTPLAAIDYIERNKPDLVFLDISLGERETLTGVDVLRAVHVTTPETRIVMVSAYEQYQAEALAWGAYGYITKPCRPKVLLELAQKVAGS